MSHNVRLVCAVTKCRHSYNIAYILHFVRLARNAQNPPRGTFPPPRQNKGLNRKTFHNILPYSVLYNSHFFIPSFFPLLKCHLRFTKLTDFVRISAFFDIERGQTSTAGKANNLCFVVQQGTGCSKSRHTMLAKTVCHAAVLALFESNKKEVKYQISCRIVFFIYHSCSCRNDRRERLTVGRAGRIQSQV